MNAHAQSHPQTYNSLTADGTYMPMSTGFQDGSWQQQQQRQGQSAMNGMHPQQQAQPVPVAAGGDMDVTGGFFSGEAKRNLFW